MPANLFERTTERRSIPSHRVAAWLAVSVWLSTWAGPVWSEGQSLPDPSRQEDSGALTDGGLPDLNRLRSRVLGFWELFTSRKRVQGLSFVLPESQEQVVNWKWPPVESFHLKDMRFLEDSAVLVEMTARVHPAGFSGGLEWPVRHQWVYREGDWFLKAAETTGMAAIFGKQLSRSTASVPAPESLKSFHIAAGLVDLGEVRRGETVWKEISYSNPGAAPVSLQIREAPSWLAFDRTDFEVPGGESGGFTMAALTDRLEDRVRGRVVLELRQADEVMTREFEVGVNVAGSLQLVPGHLILSPGRRYQVLVRNSGDERIEIVEFRPSAAFVRVNPAEGPVFVEPGGGAVIEVEWDAGEAPEEWAGGWIVLSLARPVDGRTSFRVNLLRGFSQGGEAER